jgi:alpha-1,3-glucosyltransferase
VYAVLLNFKHIFLYVAPCFGLLYLRKAVFSQTLGKGINNFLRLAGQTVAVFALSFGPFIWVGGMDQLRGIGLQMFPFERGLVHRYPAANFWVVFIAYKKYIENLFKWLIKGGNLEFYFEPELDIDVEQAKVWCMLASLAFLVVSLNS